MRFNSSSYCRFPRRGSFTHADSSAKLMVEEPDALIAHIRICGGRVEQSLGLPDYLRFQIGLMNKPE